MIRKFNINNAIKGRIQLQLKMHCDNGSITFEKGKNRNSQVVTVDESRIDSIELNHLYRTFLPKSREIK